MFELLEHCALLIARQRSALKDELIECDPVLGSFCGRDPVRALYELARGLGADHLRRLDPICVLRA